MCTGCVTSLCVYKTPLAQTLVREYDLYITIWLWRLPRFGIWREEFNSFYLLAEKVGQDDQGEDGNNVTAGIAVKNVAIPQDADAEEYYRALDLSEYFDVAAGGHSHGA